MGCGGVKGAVACDEMRAAWLCHSHGYHLPYLPKPPISNLHPPAPNTRNDPGNLKNQSQDSHESPRP